MSLVARDPLASLYSVRPMRILGTAVFVLLVHLLLGWTWTVGAALAGGLLAPRHGWLVGAAGAALAWATLLIYTVTTAPAASRVLLDTVGALAGNIPGAAVVALTVMLGGLLGAVGGALGTVIRPVFRPFLSGSQS